MNCTLRLNAGFKPNATYETFAPKTRTRRTIGRLLPQVIGLLGCSNQQQQQAMANLEGLIGKQDGAVE